MDDAQHGDLTRIQDAVMSTSGAGGGRRGEKVGDDEAGADALAALEALHRLRDELVDWEPLLIARARAAGVSWARLAPTLGVTSRQAAERRYLRLRPSYGDELTREERVRATRDERAGDRAVSSWARKNASELRQIAGQVSALGGLSPAGRSGARTLATSLTADDPASLLEPLSEMYEHLVQEHARLAEQVSAVTRRVTRVRADTQRQRSRSGQS